MRNRLFGLFVLLAALIGAGPVDAACWQWSKTAGNNATADPSINWAEGQSPSSVNDSARAMMARIAECRDDLSGALLTTGTATAYAVTTNQGLNAVPTDGQQLVVRLNLANGTAATLAADGGTAYAIQSAPGTAVASGTLIAGTPYRVTFNLASTAWVLQDFYNAPLPNGSVTYAKIQNVAANRLLGNPTGAPAAPAEIPLGANLAFSAGALAASFDPSAQLPGFLSGLTLSTAGASATFGVDVGGANDSSATAMVALASAYTKTTSAWAVGSGNGALDTSTIAINTWYSVFIMKRPDTAVVDVCVTVIANASCVTGGNIPAAYTKFRRIGYMKTDGASQWVKFTQTYDTFILGTSVVDVNNIATTTGRVSKTLSVPPAVVAALFRASLNAPASTVATLFTSLQETDQAPSNAFADLVTIAGAITGGSFERFTDATGQIGVRSTTTAGTYSINSYGWKDSRGK